MAQFAEARAMELALEVVAAKVADDYDAENVARQTLFDYLDAFTGRELRELRVAAGVISMVAREVSGR